jgi:choline kinase
MVKGMNVNMKLFILAAGMGSRLGPLTKNTPKSLIDFGDGTTLLERQIMNAINCRIIKEIVIITGYKADQIEAKIKNYEKDIKITTVYNPFYHISNNLISLWTAHYKMNEEDFIVTNGDNFYKSEEVFQKIISCEHDIIQLTIDYKEIYDEDDMKVKLDKDKNVIKVSKEIRVEETQAESVGLCLVKGNKSRRIFIKKLLDLVRLEEYIGRFWLDLINAIIEDGVTVKSVEIGKDQWEEIDFHPNIVEMKQIILKSYIEQINLNKTKV